MLPALRMQHDLTVTDGTQFCMSSPAAGSVLDTVNAVHQATSSVCVPVHAFIRVALVFELRKLLTTCMPIHALPAVADMFVSAGLAMS
jgi:hypothetical protein